MAPNSASRALLTWVSIGSSATSLAGCGSSSAGTPSPTGPAVVVDAPACEERMETLYTTPGGSESGIGPIAVGADGFLYFAQNGVMALSLADKSVRTVVSADQLGSVEVTALWVDGSALLIQDWEKFYTLPTSGGTPQLIAQLPTTSGYEPPQAGTAVMDSHGFYVMAHDAPTLTTSVWQVPRAGGPPQVLASASDEEYPYLAAYPYESTLSQDAASLYFEADGGKVMTLPKAGGTPKVLQTIAGGFASFAIQQDQVFAVGDASQLLRYPLNGKPTATAIDGARGFTGDYDNGTLGVAESLIGDGQGAYVTVQTTEPLTNGTCPSTGCSTRLLVAPVPSESQIVSAPACTKATVGTQQYGIWQEALDATHVYLLAAIDDGKVVYPPPSVYPAQAILRAAR